MATQTASDLVFRGGVMQLSDEEWAQVLDVARRTAMRITRDPALSDDIAASTVERLLERNPDIEDGRLLAYAAQAAHNLAIDELRRVQRQPRQAELEEDPKDPAAGYVILAMQQMSPSTAVLRGEMKRRCHEVAQEILGSLNEREIRLLQLSIDGVPSVEIAAELGYADANTVNVTRHRINRKIRERFSHRISPSLFA